MNRKVEVRELGKMEYEAAWEYQEQLFQHILEIKKSNRREGTNLPTPNYLLFVEHPHVYTLGKSGNSENLLLSAENLVEKGAQFIKTNRGGDITYHGPGQIVAYPILDLENFFTDVHKYLRLLEEAVIFTLKEYGVKGTMSEGETGVWIDAETPFARKICALGVRASRWVTMHGLALNVNVNLDFFNHIIPCGIADKAVTSLNVEVGKKEIDSAQVEEKFLKHFLQLFEAEAVPAEKNLF